MTNDDAPTEENMETRLPVTRRSLLATLGIASLAGCNALEDYDEPEDEGQPDDSVGLGPNPNTMKNNHVDAIADLSYTLTATYDGGDTTLGKNVEYRRDTGADAAELREVTDGLEEFEEVMHSFSSDVHSASVQFDDGDSATLELEENPDKIIQITGESVLDAFLIGSSFDLVKDEDGLVTYDVTSHSDYDLKSGEVMIDEDGIIREYEFSWLDSDDTLQTVFLSVDGVEDTNITSY